MRNLNLFLAVFWLVLGVGLVLWHWLDPEAQAFAIWGTNWSPGWLGILLAGYNLVRWYSVRAHFQRQKADEEAWLRRAEGRTRGRPDVTPDPSFNFTDAPATPPAERTAIRADEAVSNPETHLTDTPPPPAPEERRD